MSLKPEGGSVHDGEVKTIMKLEDLVSIDQLEDFLSGTRDVAFSALSDKDACYRWIQRELVKFRYPTLSRQGKGVVVRYLMKISGYCSRTPSRALSRIPLDARIPSAPPVPALPGGASRRLVHHSILFF